MTPNLVNGEALKSQTAARRGSAPADGVETVAPPRTRNAEETLGLTAGSGLLRACVEGALITTVLLAALTVVPYFWDRVFPATAQAGAGTKPDAPADVPAPGAAPAPATPVSPTPGPDAIAKKLPAGPTDPAAKVTPKGKADILDALGENGSKTASPKANPLDKKDDDILKDLK